jgi:hypothetical protein
MPKAKCDKGLSKISSLLIINLVMLEPNLVVDLSTHELDQLVVLVVDLSTPELDQLLGLIVDLSTLELEQLVLAPSVLA